MAVLTLYGMTIIWYFHFTESSSPGRNPLPTHLRILFVVIISGNDRISSISFAS
jgi:hypothetical protein